MRRLGAPLQSGALATAPKGTALPRAYSSVPRELKALRARAAALAGRRPVAPARPAAAASLSSISLPRTAPAPAASSVDPTTRYTVAQHPDFEVLKSEAVTEHGALATLYRHKGTGCEVLSVQCQEEEKVFGIAFKTPPSDDTGVAHIIEHSVLCGSRRYPVKEPFVQLLKSSLQTFLNAMTYPDRTVYPVASPSTQDFYNLVDVYMDAVLFPRFSGRIAGGVGGGGSGGDAAARFADGRWVLLQEGWHLEPAEAASDAAASEEPTSSSSSPLIYKGVVFNEMKGVYSSPEAIRSNVVSEALFPANAYALSSGGDPLAVPSLTWDAFKAFHERYYHPSNARVWWFGDDDAGKRLDIMAAYLNTFTAREGLDESATVAPQPLFKEPVHVSRPYPADAGGEEGGNGKDKHDLVVNWVLHDAPGVGNPTIPAPDAVDRLGLGMLNHLLMRTQVSSLYKALTDSALGSAVIGGGLDDSLLQTTFGAGLKGVKAEDVEKVEALVLDTLRAVAQAGFSQEHIDSAFNTVEFAMREFATGGEPRGLSLFLGGLPGWLYGRDPIEELRFEAPLAALKTRLASQPDYFQQLISRYLLGNSHRVTVHMYPDPAFTARRDAREKAALDLAAAQLGPEGIAATAAEAAALLEVQTTPDPPEAVATIPVLSVADLPKAAKTIPRTVRPLGGSGGSGSSLSVSTSSSSSSPTLLLHDQPTNGIAYASLVFDVSPLPARLLPLLPLFTWCLTSTGTAKTEEVAMAHAMGTHTGGIGASVSASERVGAPVGTTQTLLSVSGKTLTSKLPQFGPLLAELLTSARLDRRDRVVTYLSSVVAGHESGLVSAGHRYASSILSAGFTKTGWVNEVLGGMTQLAAARALLARLNDPNPAAAAAAFDALTAHLEEIRDRLLTRCNSIATLTADAATLGAAEAALQGALGELPSGTSAPSAGSPLPGFGGDCSGWAWTPSNPAAMAAAGAAPGALPLWPLGTDASPDALASTSASSELGLGIVLPTQVNYVVKAGRGFTPSSGGVVSGAAEVVSNYLRTGYLWETVRVTGGAYGGFPTLNRFTGVAGYGSYRDPNLGATLDAFDGVGPYLRELLSSTPADELRAELDKAIIATVGSADAPQAPAERGETSVARYLAGVTDDMVQARRAQVLGTSAADVEAYAVAADAVAASGRTVVVGSEAAFADYAASKGRVNFALIRPLQ